MKELTYREIIDPDDKILYQVDILFLEMYEQMTELGLMIPLDTAGVRKWMNSIKKNLNRFGILEVALKNDRLVGFAHGAISITPDYLGNKKVGVVTHIYVQPFYRMSKVGRQLLNNLEKWFENKGVHSIELQVLHENAAAIKFWDEMGYHRELLQYRKLI
jgi:ribosomal protein S18 acetylase RimI-like enzyme